MYPANKKAENVNGPRNAGLKIRRKDGLKKDTGATTSGGVGLSSKKKKATVI